MNNNKKFIRKPGKPKPNTLQNFKPELHILCPELKNLTEKDLEKILDDDEEDNDEYK